MFFARSLKWGRTCFLAAQRRRKSAVGASADAGNAAGRATPDFGGWKGPLSAAVTCGSLSMVGDSLAQILARTMNKEDAGGAHDVVRTLRMGGFGFSFYGPFQHYWYRILDWKLPLRSTSHFLTKVALNQFVLGTLVTTLVFSWTLAWTGQLHGFTEKMKNDFIPTVTTGWKFWVPASSLNFYCIPVNWQVLYMSSCAVIWTGYLGYASNKSSPKS